MEPFNGVIDGWETFPILEAIRDRKAMIKDQRTELRIVCHFSGSMTIKEMKALIGKRVNVTEA